MEPVELLPSQNGAEKGHVEYGEGLDRKSEKANTDSGIEAGAEKVEQASEAAAAIADSSFPTILPTPVVVAPVQDVTGTQDDTSLVAGTPLVAGDEDLIEREWVDKAKKIVNDTKDDPYTREEAVNQLQKDYQQKRYGRGLGEA